MQLALRPLFQDDARTFASWEMDAIFCRHAGWSPHTDPVEAVEWWRDRLSHPDPRSTQLLVCSGDSAVGCVEFYGHGPVERELGYLIGPSSSWGRGLGTAAARAGLAYGFGAMHLERIWAEAASANVASVRILRSIGMREVGIVGDEEFLGAASARVRFEMASTDARAAQGRTVLNVCAGY